MDDHARIENHAPRERIVLQCIQNNGVDYTVHADRVRELCVQVVISCHSLRMRATTSAQRKAQSRSDEYVR